MFVRSGSTTTTREPKRAALRFHRIWFLVALCGLCASTAEAQATSQRHIPIKKETRHVDTVWIHDTVTITLAKVDTVRLAAGAVAPEAFARIDTLMHIDTARICRDFAFPIPIPIPFNHGDTPGASSVSATPEPSTIVLVGLGLATVGVIARGRNKKTRDKPKDD